MSVTFQYFLDRIEELVIPDTMELTVSGLGLKLVSGSYSTQDPSVVLPFSLRVTEFTVLTFHWNSIQQIKVLPYRNGLPLYWNGTEWVESDETFTQSVTLTELASHLADLVGNGCSLQFRVFFHSDGTTTPYLTSVEVGNRVDQRDTEYNWVRVYGNIKNVLQGADNLSQIFVMLNRSSAVYKESMVYSKIWPVDVDSNGDFEVYLVETENMAAGTYYKFVIGENAFFRKVPNVSEILFSELPEGR